MTVDTDPLNKNKLVIARQMNKVDSAIQSSIGSQLFWHLTYLIIDVSVLIRHAESTVNRTLKQEAEYPQ